MGLDMYLYKVDKKIKNNKDSEHLNLIDLMATRLFYFRKHSDLHNLIEYICAKKYNKEDIYCCTVILDKEDVEEIILKHKQVLHTKDMFKNAVCSLNNVSDIVDDNIDTNEFSGSIYVFEKIYKDIDWEKESLIYIEN